MRTPSREAQNAGLYGGKRVTSAAHSIVDGSAEVVAPDETLIERGAHAVVPANVLKEETRNSVGSLDPATIVDGFANKQIDLPVWLDGSVEPWTRWRPPRCRGRTYILTVDAIGPPYSNLADIGIGIVAPNGRVIIASHANTQNALILAAGDIHVMAHSIVGNDACSGDTALFVTKSDLRFDAQANICGARFLAGGDVATISHVRFEAIGVLGRDVSFGANITRETGADGSHPVWSSPPTLPTCRRR